MTNLDLLRFWAIEAVMSCTDEELLDFVDKLLIYERRADNG